MHRESLLLPDLLPAPGLSKLTLSMLSPSAMLAACALLIPAAIFAAGSITRNRDVKRRPLRKKTGTIALKPGETSSGAIDVKLG